MPRLLPGPNAKTTPHRGARRGALLVALLLTACTSESVMSPRPDADLVRRTSVSAPQTEVRMVGFQGRPLDPAGLMMQSNVMPPEEVACRRRSTGSASPIATCRGSTMAATAASTFPWR